MSTQRTLTEARERQDLRWYNNPSNLGWPILPGDQLRASVVPKRRHGESPTLGGHVSKGWWGVIIGCLAAGTPTNKQLPTGSIAKKNSGVEKTCRTTVMEGHYIRSAGEAFIRMEGGRAAFTYRKR